MLTYTIKSSQIFNNIFIPKYYDPELREDIEKLAVTHELLTIQSMLEKELIEVSTGDEIGKMAYGTGSIPFVRTSDITNWEIKTIPKQGVSEDVYESYAGKQNVEEGDILLVRDGTYLIGTNCIINQLDLPMIYQSHILKIRINDKEKLNPYLFFLSLNSELVQRQIRNIQFTADIIDTIGNRYKEIIIPIPKDINRKSELIAKAKSAIESRGKDKATIKQLPLLVEQALSSGDLSALHSFHELSVDEIKEILVQDTTTLEFGDTVTYKMNSSQLNNNIYLPKYYDPTIKSTLDDLRQVCNIISIGELVEKGILLLQTGDEIGKMAYGTGEIPFVRTSDFSNWEIKADAKQGVSEDIYEAYVKKEDIQANDILLVRDGTYLVGTSCIITETDTKMLYCGGLYKIRTLDSESVDPFLLLGLLNSYIVKRQIRTKQFTRDVIDTLGRRIAEVELPIPKDKKLAQQLAHEIKELVLRRIDARNVLTKLSREIIQN